VGLAYPFLEAGARSLLVSLWPVNDRATALLMTRFYESWLGEPGTEGRTRSSKSEALREAKRWLREYRDPDGRRPYEHPLYWSAFILIGDGA
jgi:CHAT domain-containing protein